MSSFTSSLIIKLEDGRIWKLYRPFTYHIGSRYNKRCVQIPAEFTTDFASIPKFLFWILPWWAKYNKSSVLHDWLYRIKVVDAQVTRKEVDDIWLEAMYVDFRHHKSGRLVAAIEYYAVRAFGWLAWKSRR